MTKVATLNVGRNGIVKSPMIAQTLDDHSVDICALQEIDINEFSRPTYINHWKSFGYHAILGSLCPRNGFSRVALVSNQPIRQVSLSNIDSPDRVVSAIIELNNTDGSPQKMLVSCFYGPVADEPAAVKLTEQIACASSGFGFPWIILGDFNAQQSESPLADLLLRGDIFSMDDGFGPLGFLPATRINSTRRIDFGLCCKKLFPTVLNHYPGIADHWLVSYTFDHLVPIATWSSPHRLQFQPKLSLDDVGAKFLDLWCPDLFNTALTSFNIDEAYRLLSDAAEHSLAGHSESSHNNVPRAQMWQPVMPGTTHKAAQQHESVLLRQLRRLERRLSHCVKMPSDVALSQKCVRNLRSLRQQVPELVDLDNIDMAQRLAAVSAACSRLATEEKAARIAIWQSHTHGHLSKQCSWLKRRCRLLTELRTSPPDKCLQFTAIHPSNVVQEQQREWASCWTRSQAPSTCHVKQFLQSLADHQQPQFEGTILWTGPALQRLAQGMTQKAAGPDDWRAADLLRLSKIFWEALALLWDTVFQSGCIPMMWKNARVALLPKNEQEWRPLSIASIFWRIGARHISMQLRPWVEQWINPHVFGAAPGRSVSHAVLRILEAAHQHNTRVFVAQDLSKFFDSVQIDHACEVAAFLGAPPQLCTLLSSFYNQGQRIMSCSGVLAPQWFTISQGIMQGCPLSPMIACMLMHVWTLAITRHGDVDAVCYIDDRTFWNRDPTDPGLSLQRARQSSDQFDQVFGFSCRKTKCHLASAHPDAALLAADFQIPQSQHLSVLGVQFPIANPLQVTLTKFKLDTVTTILSLVHCVAVTFHDRKKLIGSMVIPKVTWAAGIATVPVDQLVQLRKHIVKAFGGRVTLHDSPQSILLELLGWKLDPLFAVEWAALRAACQYFSKPPSWINSCSANFAPIHAFQLFSLAKATLEHWGWRFDPSLGAITRTDQSGTIRAFQIGFDAPGMLFAWLQEAYRRTVLANCRRVKESLHRPNAEHTACGLDPPGVEPNAMCQFAGHCQSFFSQGADLRLRQAAQASGGSFWACNQGKTLAPDHPRNFCLCGLKFPSRAHLLWVCPRAQSLRENLTLPVNRVEERMYKCTHEFPAPPVALPASGMLDFMVEEFCRAAVDRTIFHVAIDGASKANVGAWAIVPDHSFQSFASGLSSEDQTPFRCELEAFRVLLQVLCRCVATVGFSPHIVILSDCKAAIHVVQGAASYCPLLAKTVRDLLLQVKCGCQGLSIHRVPAHGRVVHAWRPPQSLTEVACRSLHERADQGARQCLNFSHSSTARAAWVEQCERNAQWERDVILAATAAGNLYRAHLEALSWWTSLRCSFGLAGLWYPRVRQPLLHHEHHFLVCMDLPVHAAWISNKVGINCVLPVHERVHSYRTLRCLISIKFSKGEFAGNHKWLSLQR